MNSTSQSVRPEVQTAAEACHPLVGDEWLQVCGRIPVDIEALAQETKVIQRKREVKSALDLLRLVLAYAVCDWSLRLVGAWATMIGLGHLSDVATRQRLRKTQAWLGRIIGMWLAQRQSPLVKRPVIVRLNDATTVSRPGSQGTDWRLHVTFDLGACCLEGVEVTDVKGGETLARHPMRAGEIHVADRGYAHPKGLGALWASLVYLVVRLNAHNVPLETADGQRFDLVPWLQAEATDQPREGSVWVTTPQGRFEARLIAQRLPEPAAEAARRRLRRNSHKKGHTPSPASLVAAGFLLVLTNLPALTWPAQQVLALYRLRWQVELLFKRLKGILDLDHLRAKDPVLAQVYLLGKLVGALLLEEWTYDLATSHVAAWFEDTVRPLSMWRWMSLWTGCLRHAIRGPLTLAHILAALPRLVRYLCDAPRKRRQQGAMARHWLGTLGLTPDIFSTVGHYASVLA
jgi:hypothetical protein